MSDFKDDWSIETETDYSEVDKDDFKAQVIAQMKRLGAKDKDVKLVTDALIKTTHLLNIHPHDVAWALMI